MSGTMKNVGTSYIHNANGGAMWNIGEGGTQYALILKRVIKEKTLKAALEAKRDDEGGESFWRLICSDKHDVRSPTVVNAISFPM